MRARAHVVALLMWLLVTAAAPAKAPKNEILGTWRGTSLCTKIPGNESCHDETVLYEFTDVPNSPDSVHVNALKMVNGKFESMGEIDFRYEPARHRWTSEFSTRRGHAVWVFWVRGNAVTGKLHELPDSTVTRNVSARRKPA